MSNLEGMQAAIVLALTDIGQETDTVTLRHTMQQHAQVAETALYPNIALLHIALGHLEAVGTITRREGEIVAERGNRPRISVALVAKDTP